MKVVLTFTFYPKHCHFTILRDLIENALRIAGLEWKWEYPK